MQTARVRAVRRDFEHKAAMIFFLASLMLLAATIPRVVRALTRDKVTPAMAPIEMIELSRAPTAAVGPHRYMVLGLGQDADTGRQVVWVRSLVTGRTGAFAVGERLFDGPVQVASIDGLTVELTSGERTSRLALTP